MARKRKQRRQSHGSAWHWKQTDAWYYTMPGTKQRVPLFDDQGTRISGKENKEAAEVSLAKERVSWASDDDNVILVRQERPKRLQIAGHPLQCAKNQFVCTETGHQPGSSSLSNTKHRRLATDPLIAHTSRIGVRLHQPGM